MAEANTNTPPESLTRFVNDSSVYGNLVTWRIKKNGQFDEHVTLQQKPLINFESITVGLCFCAASIIGAFTVKYYANQMPGGSANKLYLALLGLGVFFVFGGPAFFALFIYLDSLRWKNKTRLQFNGNTKVLQLPCDNAEYHPNDYKRLMVGYTSGYHISQGESMSAAQFYLLVLDQNSVWKRHDLGIAMNRSHARKTVKKLQAFLNCESFERKMKRSECKRLNKPEE